MPTGINIGKAQRKLLLSGDLDKIGTDEILFEIATNFMERFAILFLKNLGNRANEKQVVASGRLLSKTTFRIVNDDTLQIIMPDYFDYPNQGVKGVNSSSNAPGSPYQFKNYGMNADGRRSIKNYIQSGKAKIDVVRKSRDKALGIGREKKHLSLIDLKTNTLIYLIKKYGIKKTSYFDLALQDTLDEV